jgi:hypothetical protein
MKQFGVSLLQFSVFITAAEISILYGRVRWKLTVPWLLDDLTMAVCSLLFGTVGIVLVLFGG